ncbi:MAG: DivIVA domain-containing protein [Anaerovoracaceae bacterium]
MITPLDIENKEFARGVRGYKEDEVDDFLDLVIIDYEKLLLENQKLKKKKPNWNLQIH